MRALVLGAGGFIGGALVQRLLENNYDVTGIDKHAHKYRELDCDFREHDLRDPAFVKSVLNESYDEIYQLAADMGGAGFVFTGDNDFEILNNSATINLNVSRYLDSAKHGVLFYSSSACVYPEYNQEDTQNPICSEESVYPAAPDSDYGWEKIFGERLYLASAKNFDTEIRIARFHNIFGPYGEWKNGREKAPAALSRKVLEAGPGGEIEIWGDGEQTRSFLYINECLDATIKLTKSQVADPLNIGSSQMVSVNQLVDLIEDIVGYRVTRRYIPGPTGVRGRNSDNRLIRERLDWMPNEDLRGGLESLIGWMRQYF